MSDLDGTMTLRFDIGILSYEPLQDFIKMVRLHFIGLIKCLVCV